MAESIVKFSIGAPASGLYADDRLAIDISGDAGKAHLSVDDEGDGRYHVLYTALSSGDYKISIRYDGKHISGSPFLAHISAKPKASQCRLSSIQPDDEQRIVGKPLSVDLFTPSPSDGVLTLRGEGPHRETLPVYMCKRGEGQRGLRLDTSFGPGTYKIHCQWAGETIPGSPVVFDVQADKASAGIHASGEGLQEAIALREARFNIRANEENLFQDGLLKVRIEGKDGQLGTAIDDEGNGTYHVTYQAPTPGTYRIDILHNGEHIPNSPFTAEIHMPPVAHRCVARGRCLDPNTTVKVGEAAEFSVDTQDAGRGTLAVAAVNPSSESIETFTSDEGNGRHSVRFTPRTQGEHRITITWSGTQIPGSPFVVKALEGLSASSILATGNALSRAFTLVPAAFNIDTVKAGLFNNGDLTVSVEGALRQKAEVNTRDLGDGSYSVTYVAPTTGSYLATIRYRNTHIPGSPFKIAVHQRPRPEKCVAKGACLEHRTQVKGGEALQFTVFSKDAGFGRLNVSAISPNGDTLAAYVAEESKEKHKVRIDTKEPGRYTINVKWGTIHIPLSPFKVRVFPPPDASKVVVDGPGVQSGLQTGSETYFWIGTHQAGLGQLHVKMHGIKDAFKIKVEAPDPQDPRQLRATYTPTKKGNYEIAISWSGVAVPGSPFKLDIIDPSQPAVAEARQKTPGKFMKKISKKTRVVGGQASYEEHRMFHDEEERSVSARARAGGPSSPTSHPAVMARQRSGSGAGALRAQRPMSWVEEDFEGARVPITIDGQSPEAMMDTRSRRKMLGRSKTDDDLPDDSAFGEEKPVMVVRSKQGASHSFRKSKSFSGEPVDPTGFGLFTKKQRREKEKGHARRRTAPTVLPPSAILGEDTGPRSPDRAWTAASGHPRGQLTSELRGRPYQLQYK